ncbi:RagB/SusD family nutrient uptake outer membrane protein, partial [Bacteroides thetaiotaomicron]|uniref:RagB/SusD family nutrient uptake outer membrane protein n=1 Tax=Bacteroides thetaiotaomicron TaxID=818 RepID=UPI0039B5F117
TFGNFFFAREYQPCDDFDCSGLYVVVETGRQWADKNYLYPLPSDQLQLNPTLGQNPGWGE